MESVIISGSQGRVTEENNLGDAVAGRILLTQLVHCLPKKKPRYKSSRTQIPEEIGVKRTG